MGLRSTEKKTETSTASGTMKRLIMMRGGPGRVYTLAVSLLLLLGGVYMFLRVAASVGETESGVGRGYEAANGVVDRDIDVRRKGAAGAGAVKDATFFTICRNSDLRGMKNSIESMEKRFNQHHHYPWVFANDEPFTEEFRETVAGLVSGDAIFTTIPKEYWDVPASVDQTVMEQQLRLLELDGVLYGGDLSYRKMCRFNSGFFYKLQALAPYNWYWRVEPNIKYSCDVPEDPFRTMVDGGKVYGFALAMTEDKRTVRKLWKTSRDYFEKRASWNASVPEGDSYDTIQHTSLGFIEQNTDTNLLVRGDFNYCHYWSNFEIGSLAFFRGPDYDGYFEALDRTGNFFYERWGDAPVHTIAVSYLLPPEKIHYFDNTGYYHEKIGNCPRDRKVFKALNCACSRYQDFSWKKYSCVPRWFKGLRLDSPHEAHH